MTAKEAIINIPYREFGVIMGYPEMIEMICDFIDDHKMTERFIDYIYAELDY
jgi:hypothetical protein